MRASDITKRLLKPIARWLQTGDPAATVDRLFSSQHVKDLQLINAVAFGAVLLICVIGLLSSFENEVLSQWPNIKTRHSDWIFLHLLFVALGNFLTFFVPVLAVFGGVLAWAYQVASARLGVVDLFACEISTLCRVAAVVDTVRRYVDKFDQGPAAEDAGTGGPQVLVVRRTGGL